MSRSAFSLVELAIVLVILGLLTGGILSGQALIRAAELRSVSSELTHYVTASQTFRSKYFALPGDMTNATAFWGAQNADVIACRTEASTTALTCNGNGDGMVGYTSTYRYEVFRFWQHLANAGLITGSFSGTAGPLGITDHVNDSNAPRSKLALAGWGLNNPGNTLSGVANYFDGSYGNTFYFGGDTGSNLPTATVLRAEEAWNIDTKIDDGKPGTGKLVTLNSNASCVTGTATTADYTLDATSIGCSFLHRDSF